MGVLPQLRLRLSKGHQKGAREDGKWRTQATGEGGAAGHHEGTRCEGCGGRRSCSPRSRAEPHLSPTSRLCPSPWPCSGLAAGPPSSASQRPPPWGRPAPAGGPAGPCPGLQWEEGRDYSRRTPGTPLSPTPHPPVPAGPPGASSSSRPRRNKEADMPARPAPVANFRPCVTPLPSPRRRTSGAVLGLTRMRRESCARVLGGKGRGAMLWRHVVAPCCEEITSDPS